MSDGSSNSVRPARTQAMRRAETRARLLDATIECLIELGYAGTTTPIVCERAGLSRGALLHHFPTKTELVLAAVAHLAAQTGARLTRMSSPPPPAGGRIEQSLEVIWHSFTGPLFYASLELWVAARTDRELHKHLYELERSLRKAIGRVCEGLMQPSAERRNDYKDQIELTLHVLRGMALQRILRPDDSERRRLFELWKRTVVAALGAHERTPGDDP
ncbi:MAG TPA: TetR/AcrR family transcriptional regulator [Polyangiales bacterium]|nr:TetR/AcrR family transcriptional regulator [Polyangiales bacterium]